ncbi:hypothetical protein BH10PSE18_BH10PSE18_18700 [soil metagenome]
MSAAAKTKVKPMAFLQIGGYQGFLLPADAAMKIVGLMQEAFHCEEHYSGPGHTYTPTRPADVEFKTVRADQLRSPKPATSDDDGDLQRLSAPMPRLPR